MQRLYKDRLYQLKGRCRQIFGHDYIWISYEAIMTGAAVKSRGYRTDVVGEFKPDDRAYRIDDGHLPEYQPRVRGYELAGALERYRAVVAAPIIQPSS